MPIKEEPVRIEFQYEQEDAHTSDGVFNIEYFSETEDGEEKKYVKITPHASSESSVLELDFLVEVVDFLRKKGVVDKKSPEVIEEVPTSSLPLPKVEIAGGSNIPMNAIPIDVTETEGVEDIASAPVSTLAPPIVNGGRSGGPKIITAETAGDSPIINRPVIRTRIGETEDPMIALEQSKMQRKTNPAKSIKRSESEDEV